MKRNESQDRSAEPIRTSSLTDFSQSNFATGRPYMGSLDTIAGASNFICAI